MHIVAGRGRAVAGSCRVRSDDAGGVSCPARSCAKVQGQTAEVKAHKREVRKPVYSNLPVIVTDIYPEGMRDNPDYVEIGVENTDRQAFEISPLPEMIIPKGMASESLLADILINKYTYHLPFYRQIQKYKELDVALSDATINDWFAAVCSKLRPLYDKLRELQERPGQAHDRLLGSRQRTKVAATYESLLPLRRYKTSHLLRRMFTPGTLPCL